jgi:hypothetical protein
MLSGPPKPHASESSYSMAGHSYSHIPRLASERHVPIAAAQHLMLQTMFLFLTQI